MPALAIVGLPDKAVSEARERVRSARIASGLALPARRITINLAPADLPKEGSHYDLPIALGLIPARFMLVAAMNPCRCGKANEPGFSCRRGPNTRCAAEYQTRISGPMGRCRAPYSKTWRGRTAAGLRYYAKPPMRCGFRRAA